MAGGGTPPATDLVAKGVGISAIAEVLGLDRKTVRRFAHAVTVEEAFLL